MTKKNHFTAELNQGENTPQQRNCCKAFDFLGRARSFVEKETQTYLAFGVVLTISFTVTLSTKINIVLLAVDVPLSSTSSKCSNKIGCNAK